MTRAVARPSTGLRGWTAPIGGNARVTCRLSTALLLGVMGTAGCSGDAERNAAGYPPAATDETVDPGPRSLHAVVVGTGSPAVVIDGGIGARSEEYRELQDRIAPTTTVVAYDRAGYGPSVAGPRPRDSLSAVADLRGLLRRLEIPAPYILVGHSLGGLNVQVYAGRHPEEVAGLVLLDPPPLRFILGQQYTELAAMAARITEEWQAIADEGSRSEDERERARAEFFRTLASEHREMFDRSARQAASIASFGEIPLVVVASGVPNPMFGDVAEEYQAFWAAESEALAAKSTRGRFVLAETSTHRLHDDAGELVAARILSLVRAVREAGRQRDRGAAAAVTPNRGRTG